MNSHRQMTTFYVETLVLIMVFIVIILVLTQIFGMARTESAHARDLTNAVILASNAAERFSAADTVEELLELTDNGNSSLYGAVLTARYDHGLQPDPDGIYTVRTVWKQEDALMYATITVSVSGDEKPVYKLSTAHVAEVEK